MPYESMLFPVYPFALRQIRVIEDVIGRLPSNYFRLLFKKKVQQIGQIQNCVFLLCKRLSIRVIL